MRRASDDVWDWLTDLKRKVQAQPEAKIELTESELSEILWALAAGKIDRIQREKLEQQLNAGYEALPRGYKAACEAMGLHRGRGGVSTRPLRSMLVAYLMEIGSGGSMWYRAAFSTREKRHGVCWRAI